MGHGLGHIWQRFTIDRFAIAPVWGAEEDNA